MHAYDGPLCDAANAHQGVPKYPLPYSLAQNLAAHTEILIFVKIAFIYSIKCKMASLDLTKSRHSSLFLSSVFQLAPLSDCLRNGISFFRS
jgi:hypothetical protein